MQILQTNTSRKPRYNIAITRITIKGDWEIGVNYELPSEDGERKVVRFSCDERPRKELIIAFQGRGGGVGGRERGEQSLPRSRVAKRNMGLSPPLLLSGFRSGGVESPPEPSPLLPAPCPLPLCQELLPNLCIICGLDTKTWESGRVSAIAFKDNEQGTMVAIALRAITFGGVITAGVEALYPKGEFLEKIGCAIAEVEDYVDGVREVQQLTIDEFLPTEGFKPVVVSNENLKEMAGF